MKQRYVFLLLLFCCAQTSFAQKQLPVIEEMKTKAENCKTVDCCQELLKSAKNNFPNNKDLHEFIKGQANRLAKVKQQTQITKKAKNNQLVEPAVAEKKIEDIPFVEPAIDLKVEEKQSADQIAEKAKVDKINDDKVIENKRIADKAEADRIAEETRRMVEKTKKEQARKEKDKNNEQAYQRNMSNYYSRMSGWKAKLIITSGVGIGAGAYALALNNQWQTKLNTLSKAATTADPTNVGTITTQSSYNTYKVAFDATKGFQSKQTLRNVCVGIGIGAAAYDAVLLLTKPKSPSRITLRPATDGYGLALHYKF